MKVELRFSLKLLWLNARREVKPETLALKLEVA